MIARYMRTRDIFGNSPAILEAAHPLSNVNSMLMDLEGNINEHILSLIAFEANPSQGLATRDICMDSEYLAFENS